MSNFVLGFICGTIFDLLCNLSIIPFKRKYAKDCNFDCSKCKVWDCERHDCIRMKEKEEKNGNWL